MNGGDSQFLSLPYYLIIVLPHSYLNFHIELFSHQHIGLLSNQHITKIILTQYGQHNNRYQDKKKQRFYVLQTTFFLTAD